MAVKDKSPVMWLLGLLVIATSFVTFGVASIDFIDETIDPIAGWIFAVGFVGIYLISDREIGNMQSYEGVSLLVPILGAIGIKMVPELDSLLAQYNPLLGFILVGVSLVGFYAVATNMELTYVVLEIILGTILAVTAGIHYNIISIEVLDNHISQISVWVFVITLAGAYVVSRRSLGTFSRNEGIAMAVGIGSYLGFMYVPQVESFVMANNPHSGVALTVVLAFAYYILMNNGDVLGN